MNPALPSLAITALLLSSCGSIIGLRKQVTTMEERGGVTVEVSPVPKQSPPTYALAWRMENGQRKDSAGFQQVSADALAAFNLNLDSVYHIGAFTDENRNGAFDAGEPLDMKVDIRPQPLTDPTVKPVILKLNLKREHNLPPGLVIQIPKENKNLGDKTNIALGEVASLSEKRFAPDAGGSGLWRPVDFLSENTLGIYFTEPYDPQRVPVVFVYGIGGSPQDWKYFLTRMDRSRQQLWFFHYPSGMRLDRVSGMLAEGLRMLKKRHGFETCHVVAHSMGGLVSRVAITKAASAEGSNFIPKFISISTPWGGHAAAESGIRHLKKPVPSWIDVAPESDYLRVLYTTPLPKGITHDLIYGSTKRGPLHLKDENDGVVTVASETEPRIAKKASSITHLPYEHVEILNQLSTAASVQRVLNR